ncbi:MAG: DUF4169 family protein [Hyphomicrobium aestuarii]|nr:DUF4169 family protein [Hyphomicrobium aestuarii]
MTAEIVNLKRFRKQKLRADKTAASDVNRARTGRTKAERAKSSRERETLDRTLDNAELQSIPVPVAANAAGFPTVAGHDDEDLDPGNVS